MSFITSTKKNKMETNEQLSKTSEAVATTFGALNFKSFDEIKAWGEEVAKSGLTPLKTGGQVVAAAMMGRELGLEPMVSVNNIIPINGKATLGIHLINSLLLKAGVVTEVVKDYFPCVPFAMKGDDGKPVLDGNGKPIIVRFGFIDEEAKDYEVKSKTIADYKTVVKMTRSVKQPDGTFKTMVCTASFSYSDAVTAKLAEKDNWKNYMAKMCLNRATAFCGRMIASDVLLGMYETAELCDANNIPYNYTEEGKVTIIDTTNSNPVKPVEQVEVLDAQAVVIQEQKETN